MITSTASDQLSPQELLKSGLFLMCECWMALFVFLFVYLGTAKLKNMLGARSLEVRELGLFEDSEWGQSLLYWHGLAKLVERPGFAAIYIHSALALVSPNRAFSNATQRTQFLDTVRARIAAPAAPSGR